MRRNPGKNTENDMLRELDLDIEKTLRDTIEREFKGKVSTELEEKLREKLKAELSDEVRNRVLRIKEELEAELSKKEEKPKEKEYLRFGLSFRIQHWVLLGSCLVLIITGIPLKFHETGWARVFFGLMGGVKTSGLIHRVGAAGLGFVAVFHVFYTFFSREGRHDFKELIPRPKDFLDFLTMVKYFLGISKTKPRFGRFSYVEKFDYWAVYWGMVIMLGSGIILWFHNAILRVFPKFVADIAREAHSDEGLLATLAIIIWHFYNAHLNPDNFPMNWAWITGRITESTMLHHHPIEYERMIGEKVAKGMKESENVKSS
ncbi:MAG: cytochrome b/b6 domain-containing protein [Candidatus Eisenbacteria bacterium]|nr:cytochrome b/b6 domain-containing protein [Candidatus Eisenbacteria bacterium]